MHTYVDKKTGRKVTVSLIDALFVPQRPVKKAKERSSEIKKTEPAPDPPAVTDTPAEENAPTNAGETPVESADTPVGDIEQPAEDMAETWHTWEPPTNFQDAASKEAAVEEATVEEAVRESTTEPVDWALKEAREEPANSDDGGDEAAEVYKKPDKVCSKFVTDEGVQLSLAKEIYLYRLNEFYERQKWLKVVAKFEEKRGKKLNPKELRRAMDDMTG